MLISHTDWGLDLMHHSSLEMTMFEVGGLAAEGSLLDEDEDDNDEDEAAAVISLAAFQNAATHFDDVIGVAPVPVCFCSRPCPKSVAVPDSLSPT